MDTHSPLQVNLIALIERDLGPGRQYGRWTLWPCPFHKDRHPSFAATDGDSTRGPYWRCYAASCGKHGGPVRWLMEYAKMTKEQALEVIGDISGHPLKILPYRANPPPPLPDNPPGPLWQARAWAVIERAQAALWGETGKVLIEWADRDPNTGEVITRQMAPIEWLTERGLKEDTLNFWKIGYIPKTWQDDPARWGLTGKPLWMARGILIPCMVGGDVWYLKIRQPKGHPKYIHVRKSQPALYMAQTLEFCDKAVFCEGELDSLLFWQEAGDLAGVVTLGSADNPLNIATWGYHLLHTKHRFTAYDTDEAGDVGGSKLAWMQTHHLTVPKLRLYDKDLTDYQKSGGNLRLWFQKSLLEKETHND